jgi:mRNA interferase MazF
MKNNNKKKNSDIMLLTLCARCATQFYNSGEHIIRRVSPNQKYKKICSYCGQRQGRDYTVQRRATK